MPEGNARRDDTSLNQSLCINSNILSDLLRGCVLATWSVSRSPGNTVGVGPVMSALKAISLPISSFHSRVRPPPPTWWKRHGLADRSWQTPKQVRQPSRVSRPITNAGRRSSLDKLVPLPRTARPIRKVIPPAMPQMGYWESRESVARLPGDKHGECAGSKMWRNRRIELYGRKLALFIAFLFSWSPEHLDRGKWTTCPGPPSDQ